MINFAHRPRVVAVVFEMLRQRCDVGVVSSKVRVISVNFRRVWTQAGQHAGARRTADRLLAVRTVKLHAAGG